VIAQVRSEEACAPRHDRRCHRVDASGAAGGGREFTKALRLG
jgi:hypothetical protein